MLETYLCNQIRAAAYARTVFKALFIDCALRNRFPVFQTGDISKIATHLCLPSVAASAINALYGKRIIGDERGVIRVADFYRVMLPLETYEPTGFLKPYDQGWRVIDTQGNVYHHAISAFAQIFGVQATSLIGFPDIEWIYEHIPQEEYGVVAASLNNTFVAEQSQQNVPLSQGRHVVALFDARDGRVRIGDPFQVLSSGEQPVILELPMATVDAYLNYAVSRPSQAIVFSKQPIVFPVEYTKNIFVPEYVQRAIAKVRKEWDIV